MKPLNITPFHSKNLLLILLAALVPHARAEILVGTNFNDSTVKIYGNNEVINKQENKTSQLIVRSRGDTRLTKTEIVDRGGGDLCLQFTDNEIESTTAQRIVTSFPTVSATSTNGNRLEGSVDLQILNHMDPLIFTMALGTSELTGPTTTAIQFGVQTFENHLQEIYYIVAPNRLVWTGVKLSIGKWYMFSFTANFSDDEKPTWALTVTPTKGGPPLLERHNLATRSKNTSVNMLTIMPGAGAKAANANPWVNLDNLTINRIR